MEFLRPLRGISKSVCHNLPPHLIPLPAYPHRILPQLRPEGLLDHQNRLECLHVHLAEEPVKSPPNSLSRHPKRFMNLLAIGALENHVAGPTRLQFHPQIFRIHQDLEILQECFVFLG